MDVGLPISIATLHNFDLSPTWPSSTTSRHSASTKDAILSTPVLVITIRVTAYRRVLRSDCAIRRYPARPLYALVSLRAAFNLCAWTAQPFTNHESYRSIAMEGVSSVSYHRAPLVHHAIRHRHPSAAPSKVHPRLPGPYALPSPHDYPHRPPLSRLPRHIITNHHQSATIPPTRPSPRLLPHPDAALATRRRRRRSGPLSRRPVQPSYVGRRRGHLRRRVANRRPGVGVSRVHW